VSLFTACEAAFGSLWAFPLLARLLLSLPVPVVVLILVPAIVLRLSVVVSVVKSVPHVVSQERWAIVLLDDILGITPENDGNTSFTCLLFLRKGIDSMLPSDVHISAERE